MSWGLAVVRRRFVMCCLAVSHSALAMADAATPAISGMRSQPDLGLPSMTRVIAAVVITLGLIVAALVVLRRWMPNIAMRRPNTGIIKVLGRAHVTPNLQAHLLEIETTRVLVVEGRHGLNLTVLPGAGCTDPNGKAASS